MDNIKEEIPDIQFVPRILSDEEAKKALLGFESIVSEIESIRKSAFQKSQDKLSNASNKNIQNKANNTFAILGGRGWGKTSILYTIKDTLEKADNNIVFPLIDLDSINGNFDTMGYILSILKKDLDQFVEKIKVNYAIENPKFKETFFYNCSYKEDNTLTRKFRKLIENYLFSNGNYRGLLVQNYTDLNSYLKKSEQMLSASSEFQWDFYEYISELAEWKKAFISSNKDDTIYQTPLFVFLFDDIDMCPEKIMELVNILNNFMYHPNVVCFISGDLGQMRRIIANKYTDRLQGSNSSKIQFSLNDKSPVNNINMSSEIASPNITRMSYDILSKTIPHPRRFSLNMWNEMSLPDFCVQQNGNKYPSLGQFLVQIMENTPEKYLFGYTIDSTNETNEKNNEYVYFTEGFCIIPNKTRELLYTYDEIRKVKNAEQNLQNLKKKILLQSIFDNINNDSDDEQPRELQNYILWELNDREPSIFTRNIQREIKSLPMNTAYQKRLYFFIFALAILNKEQELLELKNRYFTFTMDVSMATEREHVVMRDFKEILVKIPFHSAIEWFNSINSFINSSGDNKENIIMLGLSRILTNSKEFDGNESQYSKFFFKIIRESKFFEHVKKFTEEYQYDSLSLINRCINSFNERPKFTDFSYLSTICNNYYSENIIRTIRSLDNIYGMKKGIGVKRKLSKVENIKRMISSYCGELDFGNASPLTEMVQNYSNESLNEHEKYRLAEKYYYSYLELVSKKFINVIELSTDSIVTVSVTNDQIRELNKVFSENNLILTARTYGIKEFCSSIDLLLTRVEQATNKDAMDCVRKMLDSEFRLHINDYKLREFLFGKPFELFYFVAMYLSLVEDIQKEEKSIIRSWLQKNDQEN